MEQLNTSSSNMFNQQTFPLTHTEAPVAILNKQKGKTAYGKQAKQNNTIAL